MYRYGDGSPFPLDENFIETLTAAVEACTNAFDPVTDLDDRREAAREARKDGDRESHRLDDLEKALTSTLAPYIPQDKKGGPTQQVAQKVAAAAKQAITEAKRQIDGRVQALEAQAAPRTIADKVLGALRPFFDEHQLPNAEWIMSWDVRGAEPSADAVATAGRVSAMFRLSPDPYRAPIRVEQLSEGVIVHMMRKGMFGKAKPAPVDLGKYVIVAFERGATEQTITLKESASKATPGLRFSIAKGGRDATWTSITIAGDAEGEANPLDTDDLAPIQKLVERASATLEDLLAHRTLVDLTFAGKTLGELDEPKLVPLEILAQLRPLARTIRDRSRASGELVLKRDIGDGRREELFVPRATLAQQFARLPAEYRKPFDEMGISGEQTQPAITLPTRPPAPPQPRGNDDPTIEVKK